MVQAALQACDRGVEGRQRTVQVVHGPAQAVEDIFDLPHRLVRVQRGLGEGLDPPSLGPATHVLSAITVIMTRMEPGETSAGSVGKLGSGLFVE